MTKDLLSEVYCHPDIPTRAVSSDATSDGSIPDGEGVSIRGYSRAVVLASFGKPSGTSDGIARVRLQYTPIVNASNTASDYADSDYSNFTTDVVSTDMVFATSDLAAGEGLAILDVSLDAQGITDGCIRAQALGDTTNAPSACVWILLFKRSGLARAQIVTPLAFS